VAVHAHLQWGLGCLLGRSPLQQQGPRQQSTVQERPANKDRKRQSRKAREGNPPSKGIVDTEPTLGSVREIGLTPNRTEQELDEATTEHRTGMA
jgi:hypothetical protein